ncbi:MAG TPA: lipocalin family protein [Saprospiraceae bacterium]|nr:lipocalin family protein [Saprospiraceae bacterium]
MKFTLKTLLLLAVAAATFVACDKDDDNGKSPEEILTSVTCWAQVKSELYNSATSQWEDQGVDDCTKDDCTNFKSDKTIAFDEGATKCDPSDPQTSVGTWSLSADGKTLTLTQDGISFAGTVIELSASKVVLEYDILGFKSRTTFQPK